MSTFIDKVNLLKGLCRGNVAYNGPAYVSVDLTRRCNLKCLNCSYHSSAQDTVTFGDQSVVDIPVPIFEELCRGLKTLGTKEILLQGEGEPLLHPDILELISIAKGAGLKVILLTNGTLLDETTCVRLVDTGLDVLKVALWASTREVYEKNYPGTNPDNFDKVLKGLKRISELKVAQGTEFPVVCLHHPINSYNFQTIDAMVELAHSTGCSWLTTATLVQRKGELGETALNDEQKIIVRQKLGAMKKRLGPLGILNNIDWTLTRYDIGGDVWSRHPCYVGWFHARIRVDGSVTPCTLCDLSFGRLKESSFGEIWNNDEWRSFRSIMITREGQSSSLGKKCNCRCCCSVRDNQRVHRIFKWFAPFFVRKPGGEEGRGGRRRAGAKKTP